MRSFIINSTDGAKWNHYPVLQDVPFPEDRERRASVSLQPDGKWKSHERSETACDQITNTSSQEIKNTLWILAKHRQQLIIGQVFRQTELYKTPCEQGI